MGQTILHKRCSVVSDGHPILPEPDQLKYGEIAINFSKGYEVFSILNTESGITVFSSDNVRDTKLSAHTSNTDIHVTSEQKASWNEAVESAHSHSNFDVINGISSTDVSNWNGINATVTAHTGNTNIHVTTAQTASWNEAASSAHSHSNIDVLTGISSADVSNWNSAYNSVSAHTGNTLIHLPQVTSSDNGKMLQVVNGQFALVTPITVYSGEGTPSNSMGNNGDIYLQTE